MDSSNEETDNSRVEDFQIGNSQIFIMAPRKSTMPPPPVSSKKGTQSRSTKNQKQKKTKVPIDDDQAEASSSRTPTPKAGPERAEVPRQRKARKAAENDELMESRPVTPVPKSSARSRRTKAVENDVKNDETMESAPVTPAPKVPIIKVAVKSKKRKAVENDETMESIPAAPTPEPADKPENNTAVENDEIMEDAPVLPVAKASDKPEKNKPIDHDEIMEDTPSSLVVKATNKAKKNKPVDHDVTMKDAPTPPVRKATDKPKKTKQSRKPVQANETVASSSSVGPPQSRLLPLQPERPENLDNEHAQSSPYNKEFTNCRAAPYLNAVFNAGASGNLNFEAVHTAAKKVARPAPVAFVPPPPPRNNIYPSGVPENIRRLYPLLEGYVPPGLPILSDKSPFHPGAVDPMISGADSPDYPSFDNSVLTQWHPNMGPDVEPERASAIKVREDSLGPEFDPHLDTNPGNMDPTRPPLDKPEMPSFMCCNNVKPIHQDNNTDGGELLKELFTKFGHHYPADWSWISPEHDDFIQAWKHNDAYIGIVDLASVRVGDDMYGQADLYGVQELERGILGRILCPVGRPTICSLDEAHDASRHRFNLVGADANFFCRVHNKFYYTFWLRLHEKGKRFVDVDSGRN